MTKNAPYGTGTVAQRMAAAAAYRHAKENTMTAQAPEVQVRKASRTSPAVVITVGGQKVRSRSPRRFHVVAVRPVAVTVDGQRWDYQTESYVATGPQTYVPFIEVIKRSDTYSTAAKAAQQYGRHHGAFAVVVDTFQAEER